MKPRQTTLIACLSAAVLAGCASGVKLDDPAPVESRSATPIAGGTGSGSGSGTATPQSRVAPVDLTKDAASSTLTRVVYFDFDSFVVKEEFRGVIDSHAKMLGADRKKRVQIEGHTDERGGREYNLALGQKRAEAVARSLTLLGVTDAQVEAVSFGEERPAANGSDEAAWAKNRRAELNNR